MKQQFYILLLTSILSCSANNNQISSSEITQEKNTTLIHPGNVSDIAVYKATPYSEEGAGYQALDFDQLPSDRIKKFSHIDETNDTEKLNELIQNLSKKGGGKIYIQTGTYLFKEVTLQSNIHITIQEGTFIQMDHTKKGKNFLFNVGMIEGKPIVENVKIVGLGNLETRPKLILNRPKNTFYRAIALGYVKNVLIENIKIEDELTKGAAIAFNPVEIDNETANIAQNVTITNVELTGGSIGYGLVQTNVGKNILLKNLSSEGGMTCRVEAHTGRQYDLGVDNIVIKNVASIHGKAAVLLQPHSVLNGRVLVDAAKSEGSTWTLFLKEGFVAKDSKRRTKGSFAPNSIFKNISMSASDNTATLSFKNFVLVPNTLKAFYKNPDFHPVLKDANYGTTNGVLARESAIIGASIAGIYIDAQYPLQLPKENEIVIIGKTENRLKILDKR
ncbi:hypothetical protein [Wenyingzhuangia sp. 2_MG-2023]|uniref:hypothetical protein n=1 Tax=Wenyingzhuangia sp. 2_MG-2023 TaxID=3062639 RepID=UPI0026E1C6C6|nr:hypothetical protein [Wenyingzhuangia sp. 2_MG-2023]MDO6736438.1 hypothetical protein [Wenyingzhuangia sp. 2_MG-2023]